MNLKGRSHIFHWRDNVNYSLLYDTIKPKKVTIFPGYKQNLRGKSNDPDTKLAAYNAVIAQCESYKQRKREREKRVSRYMVLGFIVPCQVRINGDRTR